ncbi:hypothetical protein ALC53_02118 [Atta colombica]|uniref:Uncharacterized protein n=1 Tax=Atta colombica TaxID=520822 RepID=A0A195BTP7_9HYME|nr:hypothetical protein ALC53_02118 [Atta colombica]
METIVKFRSDEIFCAGQTLIDFPSQRLQQSSIPRDVSEAIDLFVDRVSFNEDIADSNKSGYSDLGFKVADDAGIDIPLVVMKLPEKHRSSELYSVTYTPHLLAVDVTSGEIQWPWQSVTTARFRNGLIALCGKSTRNFKTKSKFLLDKWTNGEEKHLEGPIESWNFLTLHRTIATTTNLAQFRSIQNSPNSTVVTRDYAIHSNLFYQL